MNADSSPPSLRSQLAAAVSDNPSHQPPWNDYAEPVIAIDLLQPDASLNRTHLFFLLQCRSEDVKVRVGVITFVMFVQYRSFVLFF